MPVTAEELVRLLALLAEEENLKVTVKETLKGGAMAGAGAVIGGMCGGPMGLAVGGAVGGAVAAYMTAGKFKSVPEILWEMDKDRRELLYDHFKLIITGIDAHDVTSLGRLIAGDPFIRGGALGTAYARWKYKGKCDQVSELLIALEADKRDQLHEHCKPIIDDYSTYDFNGMNRLLSEDGELRERMLQSLKSYITDTLKQPLFEEVKQRGKAE